MNCIINRVVNHKLGSTLSDLSFPVEHEAPTKSVDFVLISTRRVSASAVDLLHSRVRHVSPLSQARVHLQLRHLAIAVIVQAADQVHSPVAISQGGVFSWCRIPTRWLENCQLSIK